MYLSVKKVAMKNLVAGSTELYEHGNINNLSIDIVSHRISQVSQLNGDVYGSLNIKLNDEVLILLTLHVNITVNFGE